MARTPKVKKPAEEKKGLWRDVAGILIAFIIVASFVSLGFIQAIVLIIFDVKITYDQAWLAAMLSLASAAFGYLVGKRPGMYVKGFDQRPLCSSCPIRLMTENQ